MLDMIIRNGTIIDGSGRPGERKDVAIRGMRIAAVDRLDGVEAKEIIDATGKIVAPGFIDSHSHADYTLPVSPTADSKVYQGVTTEVVGNCGISAAPLSFAMQAKKDANSLFGSFGLSWNWDSFSSYLKLLEDTGTSVNIVTLVGHGTIREAVMGMSDTAPSPDQLDQMKNEVRKAFEAGAAGLSTGLIYAPNVYADTPEIIALARVAAEMGGFYTSHIRGEASTLLEAIDEAIEIGRRAQLPVEISHLKAELRVNWHKMGEAIAKIDEARALGLDISADMYPYNAFCTTMTSLLPAWALAGGKEAMCARLNDPVYRTEIRRSVARDARDGEPGYWEGTLISHCDKRPEYQGRNLQELADERKLAPEDLALDILLEVGGEVDMVQFAMKEENVEMGLGTGYVMIGSDGEGRAIEGRMSHGKPHPRNYGTFPRILGYYTRQRHVFPLEEAVAKMTGKPAQKFGLRERGLLRPGYFADITIFDPKRVSDTATFNDPHQYPVGIEYVFVNGSPTLRAGRHTRQRPGMVLKH